MAQARKPRLIDVDGSPSEAYDHDAQFSAAEAVEAMNQGFANAGETAKKAMETAQTMQEEVTQFWRQRFQVNNEAVSEMLKCRSWPEMIEVQQNWLKTTGDQYSSYLTRMFSLMQSSFGMPRDKH
ncbi:MAG TPA: hypothetical protein DCL54_18310 [Alphaproteobacteria bacterium]|nr:hypothetical protein [Alphaproteobacteria bacterium]HAJ48535.1 hypothetical protein [Alphaproteobacteria bacterium]